MDNTWTIVYPLKLSLNLIFALDCLSLKIEKQLQGMNNLKESLLDWETVSRDKQSRAKLRLKQKIDKKKKMLDFLIFNMQKEFLILWIN